MSGSGAEFAAEEHPETLATAIKIGHPVSWPKAEREVRATNGVVEFAAEREIADAKAVIGLCGIGCEPASAATLAGIKKLVASGAMSRGDRVVAVLTGNLLKDPDYSYSYHTGNLVTHDGAKVMAAFANTPVKAPNDPDRIAAMLA
jgi:threonine synthase